MKVLIFLGLVMGSTLLFFAFSARGNKKGEKENCLSKDNFILIRDSSFSDQLSKYDIHRKDNELKFTPKEENYTLFLLKLKIEDSSVNLIGLDGYGIRDQKYLKDICDLINKIKEKTKQ